MSSARMIVALAKNLPKYSGRTGAIGGTAVGFGGLTLMDALDSGWGSQRQYTTVDKVQNAACSLICSSSNLI